MRNLIFVGIALIAIFGLLNAVSDTGPAAQAPAPAPNNLTFFDTDDPFLADAGVIALGAIAVLVVVILVRGPHPNSTTSTNKAIIAAVVLCACVWFLASAAQSGGTGEGDLLQIMLDAW